MVTINGESKDAAGNDLKDYLESMGFDLMKIVVEKNLEIIPREELGKHVIKDGDTIEVLRFVGGG
ncbi:MAG: sulfur carrier protein ThiS [Lachnospiraceae bacterium]|nr:sulfur carrier protein ThiS [Lachnospiraceae bacterium]